jgi:vancomycin resistance protein YoaR
MDYSSGREMRAVEAEEAPSSGWQGPGAGLPRSRQARVATGAAVVAVGLALIGVVAFGGYQLAYAGRVYPGVEALGVSLGGLSTADAEAALAAHVEAELNAPVALVAADTRRTATWRDLGLRPATQALTSAAVAVGRSGDPLRRVRDQWTAATRQYAVDAPAAFDEDALTSYLQTIAREVDRPPRDARLLVQPDATVQYTASETGRRLDVASAAVQVRAARRADLDEIALPVAETPPQTPDALRCEAREMAERALARPLLLTYEGRQWTVERRELADWLDFEGGAGERMVARLDPDAVRRRVAAVAAELDRPAQNARLDWNDGNPRVIRAAAAGRRLDRAAAQQLIVDRAQSEDRTVPLPVAVEAPAVTGEKLAALGLREQVEGSRTTFAGSVPEKIHNIKLAAERLHGVVVPPGGLFSFNREEGPTTLASGFQWGFGITSSDEGLRTVPSVAGGICQVATTLFQAFFWSGYRLEERHWHLYWIPAYTSRDVVGLDATVDEDSDLDLQFVNTTPHAILIQAATDDTSVTFRLYGTRPAWRVDVAPPEIANRVPPDPRPVVEEDATLPAGRRVAVESAREGFEVTVVRAVTEGSDVRTLRLKSTYQPSRNVTLVGTGGALPAAAPSDQNRPVGAGSRE